MIQALNISSTDYYISTDAVLYAYEGDAGALVVVADPMLLSHTKAIELFPAGSDFTIDGTTYADFKTDTAAGTFDDFTHDTLTEVYVNCKYAKRLIEDGTDTVIHFNNMVSVTVTETISAVTTKINAKVNVSGGGSPTITTIEQDLGSLLSHGSFTVTDASCTTSSEVNIWQAFVPLRNKGTLPDENMMDRLRLYATPLTGEFLVNWEVEPTTVTVRELYNGSVRNTGAIPQQDVAGLFKTIRLGIVSGYFTFKYTIQN